MAAAALTLILPGLDGRPEWWADPGFQPDAPALAAIGARALRRAQDVPPYLRLCAQFNLTAGEADPPLAALWHRVECAGPNDGAWLRADPVHLHAQRDTLVLFDEAAFELGVAEAAALRASIDAHLAPDGLVLQCGAVPTHWYLRLPSPPALRTAPPDSVRGRDIRACLPQGPDARRWRALMNEAQMVLHEHPVNRERGARGEPEINSVWFWGGGAVQAPLARPFDAAMGDAAQVPALAAGAGIPWSRLPERADDLPRARILAADGRLAAAVMAGDPAAWCAALRDLDRQWFLPLLRRVQRGALTALELHGERFELVLTPAAARRIWRRQAIASVLGAIDPPD
ncbi:MAG: hypothetical protein AB7Q97_14870 [Gammaproteobacteria bacterium]